MVLVVICPSPIRPLLGALPHLLNLLHGQGVGDVLLVCENQQSCSHQPLLLQQIVQLLPANSTRPHHYVIQLHKGLPGDKQHHAYPHFQGLGIGLWSLRVRWTDAQLACSHLAGLGLHCPPPRSGHPSSQSSSASMGAESSVPLHPRCSACTCQTEAQREVQGVCSDLSRRGGKCSPLCPPPKYCGPQCVDYITKAHTKIQYR